jgi:DHA2 family multidrug resistance protein-like MFS transporter
MGRMPALPLTGGLAVGMAFVRRQGRLADPLIDLRLFRVPAFSGALAANTLGFFVNFGIAVFIAQYLQLVLGLSPLEAGLWTVPWAGGFIIGSMLTPAIVSRMSPASTIAGGLGLAAAGFGLLTQVTGDTSLATLVTGSVVLALGLAPVFTLAADLMVSAAPPDRAGAAAGISETSSELGGAVGIAVLGVIGTAVYRGEVADAVPAAVPPDAAQAARDTLGGAVAAGDELPDPLGRAGRCGQRRVHPGAAAGRRPQRRGRDRGCRPRLGAAPARGGGSQGRGPAGRGGRCARPGSHAVLAEATEDRRGARRDWRMR